MNETLDTLSRELLERLSTEEARPRETPGTHLVGGFVKAGATLEALLRAAVAEIAEVDGVDPSVVLAATVGQAPPLRKVMAGPLAYGIRDYVARRSRGVRLSPQIQEIVNDLSRPNSRIFGFINARNKVAKEGKDPERASLAVRELRVFVNAFRRSGGWGRSRAS